jgi:hypothetical protein
LTNGNCNKTTTNNDNGGFDDDNGEKLPYVEAHQRHELMLLRMEDLLTNGMGDDETPRCLTSAAYLCDNLVNFARQLSMYEIDTGWAKITAARWEDMADSTSTR